MTKLWKVLRWILVLPASGIAGWAVMSLDDILRSFAGPYGLAIAVCLAAAAALYVNKIVSPNPATSLPMMIVLMMGSLAILLLTRWRIYLDNSLVFGYVAGIVAMTLLLRGEFVGKPWLRALRWQLFLPAAAIAGVAAYWAGSAAWEGVRHLAGLQADPEKVFQNAVLLGLASAVYVLVAGLVAPKGRAEIALLTPILTFFSALLVGSGGGHRQMLFALSGWALGTLAGSLPVFRLGRPKQEPWLRAGAGTGSGPPRYKGTAPYQDLELDRHTFFGRDAECRQLLSMVLAERLVVLFSKSGLGKSSLINAGLVEPLRKQGYLPMSVRLNDPRQSPLASVFEAAQRAVQAAGADLVGGDKTSAWRFFKTAEFWTEGNDLLRPVLILDQFEELFTLQGAEARRVFISQLAELVRGRSPAARELDGATADQAPLDDAPPDVRIVIALREEFLANLQDMAEEIPAILHNRFRLGPLSAAAARAAIIEPARLEGETFETGRFFYDDAAVERIVAFLAKRRLGTGTAETDEVEPVQLQLICHYLEEVVRSRQRAKGPAAELRITEADLGGEEQMLQVLEGFYDRTIGAIRPRRLASRVRRLCEKRLISEGGRRLTEDQEQIEGRYGISAGLLGQLVDARLLRAEPRLGGTSYEVSHDRLVDPIRQSGRKRRNLRLRLGATAVPLCLAVSFSLVSWEINRRGEVKVLERKLYDHEAKVAIGAAGALVRGYDYDRGKLLDLAELRSHEQRLPMKPLPRNAPGALGADGAGDLSGAGVTPVLNPSAFAALANSGRWTKASAENVLEHIDTNYKGFIDADKPGVDHLVVLGALVATLGDLATVQDVRERSIKLRTEVITYFRAVYSLGNCAGASDGIVTAGELETCFGVKLKLGPSSGRVRGNWYEAVAYAALRGGRLPSRAEASGDEWTADANRVLDPQRRGRGLGLESDIERNFRVLPPAQP